MRPPQFNLRFVLFAIALVSVGFAMITRQKRIASRLRQHNVRIAYRFQYDDWDDHNRYSLNSDAALSGISRLIGPDLASTIVDVSAHNAKHPGEIARIASQLPNLRRIAIQDCHLSDEDLEHFVGMQQLRVLHLRGTMLTDACSKTLAQMNQLRVLNVKNTSLSQQALEELILALPSTRIHSGTTTPGRM